MVVWWRGAGRCGGGIGKEDSGATVEAHHRVYCLAENGLRWTVEENRWRRRRRRSDVDGRNSDSGFVDNGGDAVIGEGRVESGRRDGGTTAGMVRIGRGKSG